MKVQRMSYRWVIVAIGCIIFFLEWGIQYSYGIFLTELCSDFGWTRTIISGGFSTYMVWHSIMNVPAGWLNDKYGPRLTLTLSIIFLCAGCSLMSTVSAPWQLYLFFGILSGTGNGLCFVPVTSTISRWFVEKRGIALGIALAGIGMGTLVLVPFAQFLISNFEWRSSYLILAGILLIVGLPLSQLMRGQSSGIESVSGGETEMIREDKHDTQSKVNFILKEAVTTKAFWFLFLMYAFLILVLQMVMVHLKALAVDIGITPVMAATFVGLVGGVSILGRIVMGGSSDKFGRKACFFVCFLLVGIAMLWLMEAQQVWQFYIFSAVFGFGYGGCIPLFPAITADWFGTRSHGKIFGTLSLAAGIGGAIGPLLGGHIFDLTGSYDIAIVTGITLAFIAAACSFLVKAPQKPKEI